MVWLIIGIIVTLVLFVVLGLEEQQKENSYGKEIVFKKNKRQFLCVFGLLICLFGCIAKVPVNSVGIIYSPFTGTSEQTLKEGYHFKSPMDKVYIISSEVQTMNIENLTTQTMDAQFLTSILDVKYKVSSENAFVVFKQYRNLENVSNSLIKPVTQRSLELITTKYNIIDILGIKRSNIYTELDTVLTDEFAKYGIEFISISITDMDGGAELEKAISDEAVAKKAVETAEQKLQQATIEAQQASVVAQAEQDAAKIKAETLRIEAEAQKAANDLLSGSLTELILREQWIEKWNGKLPEYYGGEDLGIMIDNTTDEE